MSQCAFSLGKAYWDERGGGEIQVLGDSLRIFAGAKCVNVGPRAISAQILRGHKAAMESRSWYGRAAATTSPCSRR
jgi:hypothetical protein